jgi:uncharacterized protein (DUF488 family)
MHVAPVFTIGHGVRPIEELLAMLQEAGVQTLVDVRRFPGSRRNPQYNQQPLRDVLASVGLSYRHAVELGGRLRNEPGEEKFTCLRVTAFRSYAARMGTPEGKQLSAGSLRSPRPASCARRPPGSAATVA